MVGIISVLMAVLIIAFCITGIWRMYSKMDEPGWKSLIPVYNLYILYQKSWQPLWFIVYLCSSIASVVLNPYTKNGTWFLILYAIASACLIIINCMLCYRIAKCFGHGIFYTIGLIILPFLFYPLLGFGKTDFCGEPF